MAHELAIATNGKVRMMSTGPVPPWRNLGTRLDGLATAEECIGAAGLDYPVESLPVFARAADGSEVPIPDRVLNVRKGDAPGDAAVRLGLVSDKYKIVQNHEAFSFMDAIVAEGGMRYDTAGALGRGERVWMLGKIPGHITVRGTADVTEKYLLLYNSHDGSSALRIAFTPIRVVCANTVRMAMQGMGQTGYTIQHTGDIAMKVEEARKALQLSSVYFNAFGEGADELAGCKPTRAMLDEYFTSLYPDPAPGPDGKAKDPAKAKATRMSLFGLFEQGMGQDMPGVRGTAWAAYNAVTEWVDHHGGRNESVRLESAWFGDGGRLKARAWDNALAMARGNDIAPVVTGGINLN